LNARLRFGRKWVRVKTWVRERERESSGACQSCGGKRETVGKKRSKKLPDLDGQR
jgi:hypothetical protein